MKKRMKSLTQDEVNVWISDDALTLLHEIKNEFYQLVRAKALALAQQQPAKHYYKDKPDMRPVEVQQALNEILRELGADPGQFSNRVARQLFHGDITNITGIEGD